MRRAITALLSLFIFLPAAFAQDNKHLIGVWKLVAYHTEFQDGKPQLAPMGTSPVGFLIFTIEGRMMAILEAEGRKPASTDEERANLLRSLIAYSGVYRVDGDKWITKVDTSWTPLWRGTEQVRTYKLDGDRLNVITDWGHNSSLPGNPFVRGVLIWERMKN